MPPVCDVRPLLLGAAGRCARSSRRRPIASSPARTSRSSCSSRWWSACIAIGQTLIILTAGIDLSCGAVMAFGGDRDDPLAVDLGVNPYLAIACRLARLRRLRTPERRPDHVRPAAAVYRHPRHPEYRVRDHADLFASRRRSPRCPTRSCSSATTFRIGQTSVTYGTVLMLGMYLLTWFVLQRDRRPAATSTRSATIRKPHGSWHHPCSGCSSSVYAIAGADSTASPRCCWSRAPASATPTPARPITWTASRRWCWAAPACSADEARSSARLIGVADRRRVPQRPDS